MVHLIITLSSKYMASTLAGYTCPPRPHPQLLYKGL